jgi:hypothetical protein
MEGVRKAMNERNLQEGQWEDRRQWSLGVGQHGGTFWNRLIYIQPPHRCIYSHFTDYIYSQLTDCIHSHHTDSTYSDHTQTVYTATTQTVYTANSDCLYSHFTDYIYSQLTDCIQPPHRLYIQRSHTDCIYSHHTDCIHSHHTYSDHTQTVYTATTQTVHTTTQPPEALHKRHSIYCVRVMSVGCTRHEVELRASSTSNRGAANRNNTHAIYQVLFV